MNAINMMKYVKLLTFFIAFSVATIAHAQTYQITHYFMTIGSSPKPYNGTLVISDSFVTFTAYPTAESNPADTLPTVTKERIAINKKGYYVKTIQGSTAKNYTIELSGDKAEKKEGIYYVTLLVVPNTGSRITLYFKGKRIDTPTGAGK